MRLIHSSLAPFVILLLASPFSEWKCANAQKTPEEVELQLTDEGVKIVQLQKTFYAPYTVEPGDTFESISTKFYGRPNYAANLAAALGVPVVHIPLAGSTAYIVSRSISLRFSPEKAKSQRRTVEEFLALLPKDKRLSYGYDGNPSLSLSETGKWVLTKFDVSAFHLNPVNQPVPTLDLKFPLQPLLNLIRGSQVLEGVTIQREDVK
jgi:hypothetical protein